METGRLNGSSRWPWAPDRVTKDTAPRLGTFRVGRKSTAEAQTAKEAVAQDKPAQVGESGRSQAPSSYLFILASMDIRKRSNTARLTL